MSSRPQQLSALQITGPSLLKACFGNMFAMLDLCLKLRWHCPCSLTAVLISFVESFGKGPVHSLFTTGMCRANVVTEDLDRMGVKRKRGGSQGVTSPQE